MKRYTRRWLLGLQSAQGQTDPNAEPIQRETYRPQPPSIQPALLQQKREIIPPPSPTRSPALAQVVAAPNNTNQPAVVASLPTTTQTGVREIVFSFDDGPSRVATAKILDVLARYRIRALFFVLGQKIAGRAGRDLMIRAHGEGHLIANHTYSHPNLTELNADQIRGELQRTQELIGAYAAPNRLMRPPYGAINDTVRQVLDEEGYTALLWTTATLDWQFQSNEWVEYTIGRIQNGPLHNHVLMHDTYTWTADNLERFIQRVQSLPNTRITSFYR